MADTKKEQEREELHRAIWAIADELRGAVDGWDFKNYVLGTMFYRYISETMLTRASIKQEILNLIMQRCRILMQKRLGRGLSKKRAFSFFQVNSSVM